MIVTTTRGGAVAAGLADQRGLAGRIDIHGADQFIALNVMELGGFEGGAVMASLKDVVARYNRIIDAHESNPSFRIEWS